MKWMYVMINATIRKRGMVRWAENVVFALLMKEKRHILDIGR